MCSYLYIIRLYQRDQQRSTWIICSDAFKWTHMIYDKIRNLHVKLYKIHRRLYVCTIICVRFRWRNKGKSPCTNFCIVVFLYSFFITIFIIFGARLFHCLFLPLIEILLRKFTSFDQSRLLLKAARSARTFLE